MEIEVHSRHRAGAVQRRCGLLCALALTPLATVAHAQTASQITPDSYAPRDTTAGGPIPLPESGSARPPEGAESLYVTLADVEVVSADAAAPPIDAGEIAALRARIAGRRIAASELFAAAHALETRLARDGNVFARVVVPEQTLVDGGTVRLLVVRGFVESIDTGTIPTPIRPRIDAILASLVGRSDIDLPALERRLMLAAQVPGAALRTTLAPGERPGGVRLVVEADYRAARLSLLYDNGLPSALGGETWGLGFDFNSVLGAGELIYLRANGLPNTTTYSSILDPDPRNRALAAGMIVPIGNDGLTVAVEGVDARSSPRSVQGAPALASRFQRASLRLRYPLVLTRAGAIELGLEADASNERLGLVRPLGLRLYQDRIRVVRGSVAARVSGLDGSFSRATARLSVGLDAAGARSADDATPNLPLSRVGADAAFTKLELGVSQRVPLGIGALRTDVSAQTSFGMPLLNAEQFGAARADGISPLTSGTLQGDSGVVGRAEIEGPVLALPGAGALRPYGFVAAASVRYARPTILEQARTDAAAYGVGVRASVAAPFRLSAALEWGRAEFRRSPASADRISASVNIEF